MPSIHRNDTTDHKLLHIPTIQHENERGLIYEVLSVGFIGRRQPIVTVNNNQNQAVTYRLPVDLRDWVEINLSNALAGRNPFPSQVEFFRFENESWIRLLR
ncbi:hypothetical protein COC69_01165 [Bacillus cereus]|uniref:Group-specific protein n=1 Tax=Bacillus cereus TaxID=1396 RepID=A0A9X7CSI1_BACCE|nr:hypothetical protein [Bacillus cereus]PGS83954.1 hypothetical protein COC69_01165 [Bacillus cereus]